MFPRKYIVFPAVFAVAVAFDQLTKAWVRWTEAMQPVHPHPDGMVVIPHFLTFVHAENPGAAFGLLTNVPEFWRMILFHVFTVVAVVVILDLWRRLPRADWFLSSTLGLILAGAIGNGIDRLFKRTVTDFVRVFTDQPSLKAWLESSPLKMSEWPAFNVADSVLLIGVAAFLVHYLFLEEKQPAAAKAAPPAPTVVPPGADRKADPADADPTEGSPPPRTEAAPADKDAGAP